MIKTILADPPWPNQHNGPSSWSKKIPQDKYNLMTILEIKKMSDWINSISDEQCHLWLWIINNKLPEGIEVMENWGFKYITNLVWVKNHFGIGQYLRSQHEILLFGRKGKPQPFKHKRNIPSILCADRREHSRKPDEIYDIIERISYPPYLELFARKPKHRENWEYWGHEAK